MEFDVSVHGPVFDGRADKAYHQFTHAASDEMAKTAADLWVRNLDQFIRVNRHRYTSTIHGTPTGALTHVISDGGHPAVYGPWLEGTGSRNKTTRFKGYFQMRRTKQVIEERVKPRVERILQRYIERMN